MGLNEVSNILWQERQLLELLLFKLEEEQLVLASGRARWLERTPPVRSSSCSRRSSGPSWPVPSRWTRWPPSSGWSPGPSLRQLAETVPRPWQGIFEQHRRAFLTTTQEILALAQVNRDLLSRGQQATREALAWLGDAEADVYTPSGATTSSYAAGPRLVNEAL